MGAVAVLLAGCAEPTPVVIGGGTVAPATAAPSGSASSGSSSAPTGTPSPSSTAARPSTATTKPSVWPTRTVDVGRTLTDTGLGHKVAVKRILRGLPWPAGYTATAQAYELVAVEMTWTPSTTYTAPLRRADFSIRTGAAFPSRPLSLVDTALRTHKMALLPSQVVTGRSATGWLVFKVDPKGAANLSLLYTRPKAQVSGGGQVFDSRTFSVVLTGSPVPTS